MSDLKQNLLEKEQESVKYQIQNSEDQQQLDGTVENGQKEEQQKIQDFEETDNNEPSPTVTKLKTKVENLEIKFRDAAGIVLLMITFAGLTLIKVSRDIVMPENTTIEIAFVAFLTSFLVNYYFVRVGNILPYIENEDLNFVAKLAGFSGLFSLVLLLFSFQNAQFESCIFVFILTWVISFATEKVYYGSRTTPRELGLITLLTISSYIILTPNFLLDYVPVEGEDAKQVLSKSEDYINKQQKGLIAALLSSVCFSYMCFNIKKIKDQDYYTITHVICLIVVLFLPVFFPIEGLHSPSIIQWVIMFGYGILFMFLLQLFIRAIQIDSPSKLLGLIPLLLSLIMLFGLFLGNIPSFLQIIGSCTIVVLSYFMFKVNYQFDSRVFTPGNCEESFNSKLGQSGIKGNFIELQHISQN